MNDLINIRLSDAGDSVVILDQTLLPNEETYLKLKYPEELYEAIYMLRVRGAPAIGIFAAYALYVLALQIHTEDIEYFYSKISEYSAYLCSSRPTAVNLETQLRRMTAAVKVLIDRNTPVKLIIDAMRDEAESIYKEDAEMCKAISEHGLSLIGNGYGIMTQCNAGPLATSKYGTALGPIILGKERGIDVHAYICETRPLLQGARLTAFELSRYNIECTLICDNMASIVMSEGKINAVFTGCDRIAANGDVANKIGTSGLAVLARYYDIPFYVFGPSTTIDINCPTGGDIKIELREQAEITAGYFSKPIAPAGIKCYNPAFDVTPGHLITAIITENGAIHRAAQDTGMYNFT